MILKMLTIDFRTVHMCLLVNYCKTLQYIDIIVQIHLCHVYDFSCDAGLTDNFIPPGKAHPPYHFTD